MIVPKIEYVGVVSTTLDAVPVHVVTVKNSSQSTVTPIGDLTSVWSLTVNTGDVVSSILTGTNELSLTCVEGTFSVIIQLSVDGILTTARLVSDGTDVAFTTLALDVFVLPENNVQFDTSYTTVDVVGSYGVTYSSYTFDYNNDGSNENTSLTPTVFSHTYSTDMTARVRGVTNVSVVFTEVGIEIYDKPLKDLIVDSVDDCFKLQAWSETVNYIEKLIGRGDVDNSAMTNLNVSVVRNCCTVDAVTFDLAPIYDFSLSASDCEQVPAVPGPGFEIVTIDGFDYQVWSTTITLNGIDAAAIDQLRFTGIDRTLPTTYTTNANSPVNEFLVEFLLPDTGPGPVISETYLIEVTNTAGFVYTIQYLLTPSYIFAPGGECSGIVFELLDISYPEVPCYVTVVEDADRTYLEIDSQLYNGCLEEGEELEALLDGVYTITLNDSGISNESVVGCTFVNCDTACLIVKALAMQCNPIIQILYDALVNADECDNISCQNYCDLYEMLLALLAECNCIDYSLNRSKSAPCGCK